MDQQGLVAKLFLNFELPSLVQRNAFQLSMLHKQGVKLRFWKKQWLDN